MSINKLVKELKENNQDYEFYPTTNEIILDLIKHIKNEGFRNNESSSFLDIGAGNGKVLNAIGKHFECQTLAIEKSKILIDKLVDKDHLILGTDLYQQKLYNIKSDIIFSNPMYSEYVQWSEKIIKECKTDYLYLVIPDRWINNDTLNHAIKFRDAEFSIVGSYTFEDSEDRKARANVNLVCIKYRRNDNPFRKLFKEVFGIDGEEIEEDNIDKETEEKEEVNEKNELIKKDGLIPVLVKYYENNLNRIQENYKKVMSIDKTVLAELQIGIDDIILKLSNRMDALREEYWQELLSKINSVTDRLTRKNRDRMMAKFEKYSKIEFNESNIYAVLIWILKNANGYMDSQIIELFNDLLNESSAIKYKSNERVFSNNDYRYNRREKISHVYLDYRIVAECGGMIKDSYGTFKPRLNSRTSTLLQDILTVAKLLKFDVDTSDPRVLECDYVESKYWNSGEKQLFCDKNGENVFEVKAFYKGTCHFRFSQKFMLALNVKMGQLKGWVHNKQQAKEELQNENIDEWYEMNYKLGKQNLMLT